VVEGKYKKEERETLLDLRKKGYRVSGSTKRRLHLWLSRTLSQGGEGFLFSGHLSERRDRSMRIEKKCRTRRAGNRASL